jgi:hypothetical protein
MPPSLAASNRTVHVQYTVALSNKYCAEEAEKALLHRCNPSKPIPVEENVATVTLYFSTGRKISKTIESGGCGIKGHSERRALALAINESIEQKIEPFIGITKIIDTLRPDPSEFEKYKLALSSLSKIVVYTERVPCTIDGRDGTEQCDKFFAKLFEGIRDYKFYYSIKLGFRKAMEQDLLKQAADAHQVYLKKQQLSKTKMLSSNFPIESGGSSSSTVLSVLSSRLAVAGAQLSITTSSTLQEPRLPTETFSFPSEILGVAGQASASASSSELQELPPVPDEPNSSQPPAKKRRPGDSSG